MCYWSGWTNAFYEQCCVWGPIGHIKRKGFKITKWKLDWFRYGKIENRLRADSLHILLKSWPSHFKAKFSKLRNLHLLRPWPWGGLPARLATVGSQGTTGGQTIMRHSRRNSIQVNNFINFSKQNVTFLSKNIDYWEYISKFQFITKYRTIWKYRINIHLFQKLSKLLLFYYKGLLYTRMLQNWKTYHRRVLTQVNDDE